MLMIQEMVVRGCLQHWRRAEWLMQQSCRARGGAEGDILIMGIVHINNAAHCRPFHQLHAAAQEDTGRTRNCPIDLCG